MSMYEIELDVWLDFDDDSLYVNREGFPAEEPALRRWVSAFFLRLNANAHELGQ